MIRRFLSNIVIVVLLAAWGYTAWQTQQLRMQVRALQIENRGILRKTGRALHSPEKAAANLSWLASADEHLERAGDALSHADPNHAEREMASAIGAMRQASRARTEQTDTEIAQASSQIKLLNARLKAVQALTNTISSKTGPQVSLLRAQADKIASQVQSYWQTHDH